MYQINHYIAGRFVEGEGEKVEVFNPAYGEVVATMAFASREQVNTAVTAAKQAFPEWANTPPSKRANVLFAFKALVEKNKAYLADLVSREHGKTLAEAKASIQRGLEFVEYACGIPAQLRGSFSENVAVEMDTYTLRQPLGVCVGVTPFNFPVMIPLWQMVAAIACGNTFILKPSEKDPSASLCLVQWLSEAGLPAGVVNCLHGEKAVVNDLLVHPDVCAITAVGSSEVAKHIYQTAISQGKRSHTFGGAKNHAVVLADADIPSVAQSITNAAYGSAGERCMALSVVVAVGEKVGDALVEHIRKNIDKLVIGPGEHPNVDVGPLITAQHKQKVLSYIDKGLAQGAELVVDGRQAKISKEGPGFFLAPSLFDRVTSCMDIYQQEIFGPVLSLVRVSTFDEALQLVNTHGYGNGTAIFTRDGGQARRFVNQVQVGMVGVNVPVPVPVAYHAFGGWKQSGFGDVGMHGDQLVQFYTKLKSVVSQWQ